MCLHEIHILVLTLICLSLLNILLISANNLVTNWIWKSHIICLLIHDMNRYDWWDLIESIWKSFSTSSFLMYFLIEELLLHGSDQCIRTSNGFSNWWSCADWHIICRFKASPWLITDVDKFFFFLIDCYFMNLNIFWNEKHV